MTRKFTTWILHQGARNNRYYSMFRRKPRVTVREVPDEVTGEPSPCYESPDPFIFNFCLYGWERLLRFKSPLGSIWKLEFTATLEGDDECQQK